MDLIRTGIEGLDEVFLGGIPHSNSILVQGAAGTGKTLMGMEFIYKGIIRYNQPGIIVVFETSPAKELSERLLPIVSAAGHAIETAKEMGARRLFVDGIGILEPRRKPASNGAEAPGANGPESYRGLLQQLLEALDRENLTCILSHEIGMLSEASLTFETAGFLCDTVIEVSNDRAGRRGHRGLEIVKSRGQDYVAGKHTLRVAFVFDGGARAPAAGNDRQFPQTAYCHRGRSAAAGGQSVAEAV